MELSTVENQSASAASFAASLRFCSPNVLKRIGSDVLFRPALTVMTQFEVVDPKEQREALKTVGEHPFNMVVVVNCIRKDQVGPPVKIIYHNGFSKEAMKEAVGRIPGFQWLPKALKEQVFLVDGMAAGDLRRAVAAARLLVEAKSFSEACSMR